MGKKLADDGVEVKAYFRLISINFSSKQKLTSQKLIISSMLALALFRKGERFPKMTVLENLRLDAFSEGDESEIQDRLDNVSCWFIN